MQSGMGEEEEFQHLLRRPVGFVMELRFRETAPGTVPAIREPRRRHFPIHRCMNQLSKDHPMTHLTMLRIQDTTSLNMVIRIRQTRDPILLTYHRTHITRRLTLSNRPQLCTTIRQTPHPLLGPNRLLSSST
jgi:hypothetical protein